MRIEGGLFVSAADYIDALRLRGVMTEKFLAGTMLPLNGRLVAESVPPITISGPVPPGNE